MQRFASISPIKVTTLSSVKPLQLSLGTSLETSSHDEKLRREKIVKNKIIKFFIDTVEFSEKS